MSFIALFTKGELGFPFLLTQMLTLLLILL